MARLSAKEKAVYLGATPKKIARELRAFSRTARIFSSNEQRLLKKYPKQWVALYGGKLRASAKSLDEVLSKLKQQGVPANQAFIRYMDTSGRKLIL
jgi:CII-binding regulator of phage lambda lysogenization HflD